MKKKISIALGMFLASTIAYAAEPGSPSFDCTKASNTVEMLICTNPELADLDVKLASQYKAALAQASDKAAVKQQQIAWIKNVRAKCLEVACVADEYSKRIADLAGTPNALPNDSAATPDATASNAPAPPNQEPQSSQNQVDTPAPEPAAKAKSDSDAPSVQTSSVAPDEQAATTKSSSGGQSPVSGMIAFALIILVVVLVKMKNAPRRGQWFVMKKLGVADLHGNQVHPDLVLGDSENDLLFQVKRALNDIPCPSCGNHKLKGDVEIKYGPVQLFNEVKTEKGYKNELIAKKWLFYGTNSGDKGNVQCPDCKWESERKGFEGFGDKAVMLLGASIAAYALYARRSNRKNGI